MTGLEQIGMLKLARECFTLPEGSFIPHWLQRPESHFGSARAAAIFNTNCAGNPAGTVRKQDGRRRIQFKYQGQRVIVYAYQVVWALTKGEWPAADIDHRDTDPSNDDPHNLRLATPSQNLANASGFAHNTSGFRGVSFDKRRGAWRAYIKVNGRYRHLGYFPGADAAASARDAAAVKAFGEFARSSR